jgi:hypothetical protein
MTNQLCKVIPNWDSLSTVVKAVIESSFNLEWWRGYHAPRPTTMRHVRMGQPAPESDTHIILNAEDYERWPLTSARESCTICRMSRRENRMKTVSLYQVRFFTGNYYSKTVGFKGRIVTREKARKLVKRLRQYGVEAFMAKMAIAAPKIVRAI